MHSRLFSLLIAVATLIVFARATHALAQSNDKEADAAVKRFLSSRKTEQESADSQGSAVADLDGDGKPELILVWTTLGPTYWHNTLTVFGKTAGAYKPVASFDLNGEAKLSSVKGGIISVDQNVYAKNDPLCCPSVKKLMKYHLVGKKISEVRR